MYKLPQELQDSKTKNPKCHVATLNVKITLNVKLFTLRVDF